MKLPKNLNFKEVFFSLSRAQPSHKLGSQLFNFWDWLNSNNPKMLWFMLVQVESALQ
jgi:hypothetical protein